MKICVLISDFAQGGAQRQCAALVNTWKQMDGVEISLVHVHEGLNFARLDTRGIQIHKLKHRSLYNPMAIIDILRIVKSERPDVIFSWMQACDVYSYFVRRIVGIDWVIAERNSAYPNDWRFKLRLLLGRKADKIICNSRQGALYWTVRGYPRVKTAVIPNILLADAPHDLKKADVIFAGRFEYQKNILKTTEAFCLFCLRSPGKKAVLLGEGSLRKEMEAILSKYNCNEHVKILPYTQQPQDFYAADPVFVSISHHEGLPNTVIENIHFDNICVVSAIEEHRDILGEQYPFYISSVATAEEISLMIESAAARKSQKDVLNKGKSYISEMDADRIAQLYIQEFKALSSH